MADEFDRIDEQTAEQPEPEGVFAAEQPEPHGAPIEELSGSADADPFAAPDPVAGSADADPFAAPGPEAGVTAAPDTAAADAVPPAELTPDGTAADAAAPDATAPAQPAEPALMDLGPERRVAWWVWLLGVLGVVAVGAVGWALWYYLLSPVTVPRVVGKDIGRATQVLNDANVRLGRTSEVPTSSAPAGTVIEQTPEAGTEVERDVEVALVVAAPPTTTSVPDVKGKKLDEAQKTLAGEELGTTVIETYDAATAAGYVISQLPSATVEMPPGSLIVLAVSKGQAPGSATVPDLRSLTPEDAERVLTALELVPAQYKSNDASVAAGQIATQSPAPGLRVNTRSTVMYLVSQGRASAAVTVPRLSGLTAKAASAKLKTAGLDGTSRKVSHPSVPSGSVIAQMPPAGGKVMKGSTVGLLVSRGPSDQLPVPSIVGTDQAAAATAITGAGFKAIVLPTPLATGTPGQVIAQWPTAGTSWPQYLPVIAVFREQ